MLKFTKPPAPEAAYPPRPDTAYDKSTGKQFRISRRGVWIALGIIALVTAILLTVFGSLLWQLVGTAALLIAVIVVILIALIVGIITLLVAAITHTRTRTRPWLQRLLRLSLVLGILLAGVAGAVIGSQWHASTPAILGADGKPLPGSIASLEQVTLNGSQQWITIRGKNTHNPVLLYLMGGPGAGGFPSNQGFLPPLEDHFVVVNWGQPGTGKSYNAVPTASLTPQRYADDAYALTQMLRARFHQDKIYVLGSSWGSILGIWLVQQHPDLFYAYVSHGQMVNTTQNDIMGYQLAIKYASQHGDTNTVNTLRHNGPPPYVGNGMAWKYAAYLSVLYEYMGDNLTLTVLLGPQIAPEYGLLDKMNWDRGLIDGFTVVYPQIANLDFTTQANKLKVPVYFLVGRQDVSAMSSLAEHYYNGLQAPHKELIWLQSGHGNMSEADFNQFVDVMVNHVLKNSK